MGRAKRYFSIPQVADQFGATEWIVRKWIRQGLLPAFKVGQIVRVADDDIRVFAAAHQQEWVEPPTPIKPTRIVSCSLCGQGFRPRGLGPHRRLRHGIPGRAAS